MLSFEHRVIELKKKEKEAVPAKVKPARPDKQVKTKAELEEQKAQEELEKLKAEEELKKQRIRR